MKSMLLKRAAPLLVTTMLVAAPAWAQSSSSDTSTGAPSATSAPSTTSNHRATTAPKSAAQNHVDGDAASAARSMENLVDRRITELHTKLQITPAQGQKWDQFAQVMRDNAKAMDQLYADRAQKLSSMSAVDNMQSFQTIEQARMQGMQKLVPAFQTVYDSLSDQQKQAADRAVPQPVGEGAGTRQAGASGPRSSPRAEGTR